MTSSHPDAPTTAAPTTVAEHLAACLAVAGELEPLTVALSDAQGCRLVGDVLAPGPLPAYGTAQLDGYAVRLADVAAATPQQPVVIPVVGEIRAGARELPVSVQPGFAVRVGAGAPLPAGTETVVPLSWTDGGMTRVAVLQAPPAGAWSRLVGEDLSAGSLLLADGTPLGPPQLALLAAAGLARVHVRPRPRAVIVSTGDGLVDIAQRAGPGQVPDANSHALAAAARDAGAQPYRVGILPQDPRQLIDTLEDHLIRADIVIAAGGSDVAAATLDKIGAVRACRVAVAPGGTFSVGTVGPDHTPYLSLPGHPLSALVGFELFVRPVLRSLQGAHPLHRPRLTGRLGIAVRSIAGVEQLLRCRLDGDVLTPLGGPGLHPLAALGGASALAVVPAEAVDLPAGTELSAIVLERRHL